MADSRYWRRPGRRDEERASFNRLVQRLVRVRLREGLSKAELARRLGVSRALVTEWFKGRRFPVGEEILHLQELMPKKR
jgi:DNA-binding transcriptional regulator YiaG